MIFLSRQYFDFVEFRYSEKAAKLYISMVHLFFHYFFALKVFTIGPKPFEFVAAILCPYLFQIDQKILENRFCIFFLN